MGMIVRGTTPTFAITFNTVTVSSINAAYLVFKHGKTAVLTKELADATVGEKSLSWKLTQEECFMIAGKSSVTVVCDWKLNDGTRGRSDVISCTIEPPGKEEVI